MKHNEQARVAPTRFGFHIYFPCSEENATRTPRAHPLAWCLVRLVAVVGLFLARSLRFIRGPTHITQTDVWVSRGEFKRRGDSISGSGVRVTVQKSRVRSFVVALRKFTPVAGRR